MLRRGAVSLICCFLAAGALLAQRSALDEAAAAFERGNAAEAQQKLQSILRERPTDLRALMLMGATLDAQQRYSEAEPYYRHVLQLAPHSAQALNNVANHYLTRGDRAHAREYYLKTVAIDPRHQNANLQLAQISVEEKRGAEALVYLDRLGPASDPDAAVRILQAHALALAGKCSESTRVLSLVPGATPNFHFSAGTVLAECRLYAQAEESFSRALDADPRNFDILYNLGLAALRAGHTDRAASVLTIALAAHPGDTDCLIALAQAWIQQRKPENAAALLVKAHAIAPNRPDAALLLAQVSFQLEFYKDAAAAYEKYLSLKPADEMARRERAYTLACSGQFKTALPDLEAWVRGHPRDATGHHELAVAQAFENPAEALRSLDRALILDPQLIQARYTRAILNMEQDKPAAAIEDLRVFLQREPENRRVLVQLGQAYLRLNRASDATEVLERALKIAPNARSVLIAYRRALQQLGRKEEAAAILARLKQAATTGDAPAPQSGLIDYLSLPPNEQRSRYLENLRRNSASDSADPRWKIRLARELLAQGKTAEGLDVFRELRSAASDPETLAACGSILIEFEQYELARQFLERAPATPSSRLDLAIALFRLEGAAVALPELRKTPAAERKGDYYLLEAELLDSLGRIQEAADSLNRGIRAAPARADLYFQASGFLLKHKLYHEALALLERACGILPDARELHLAQAVTLELLRRGVDAQKLLAKMQTRWPEWDRPYLLHGILLEMELRSSEARQALETAIALGADIPEAYYYEALAIVHSAPDDLKSARDAIDRAMALNSRDPWIYLLSGKILLGQRNYPAAIQRLMEATQLHPALIPAHYALRDAYRALGDERKAAAELEQIKRIASHGGGSEQNPWPMEEFLFTVRRPG